MLKADLHVHTCLSPCGAVGMSPDRIARRASELGIDILCICDHNSAENTVAAVEAGRCHGVHVLAGLEVCSAEEVHVLAMFGDPGLALELQEIVYRHLPGTNDEEMFGMQVIASAEDEVLGFCQRLLIGATTLGIEEIVRITHGLGGLSVAAHVDRESFGLMGQLGFVPEGLALDALEVSSALSLPEARRRFGADVPVIRSSDAHELDEMGRAFTVLSVESADIGEVRKALEGREGRRILR